MTFSGPGGSGRGINLTAITDCHSQGDHSPPTNPPRPGGKLEFGESLEDTARREALEEAGCVVGSMSGIGLYEMRGQWAQGPYHFMMHVFLANQPALVPDGFVGHHVTAVQQMRPSQVHPHPTDMQILNDACPTGAWLN